MSGTGEPPEVRELVRALRVGNARSNFRPTVREIGTNLLCAWATTRYAARDLRTIVTGGRR